MEQQSIDRKNNLIIAGVFFSILLVDQLAKQWALGLDDIIGFGKLNLFPTYNKVGFYGIFPDIPKKVKSVGLTTFASIFIVFFGFIQTVLPPRLMGLRLGFAFLLAGVLGNLMDRLFFDHIIDFIILGSKEDIFYVFNLADVAEVIGYFLVVHNIIKYFEVLWPKENKRKKKWINPPFQLRFIFFSFGLLSSLSLLLLVFTYSYFKVTLNEYLGNKPELVEHIFQLFVRLYILINLVLFMCYYVIALLASHRIAGPIYGFKKYVAELLNPPRFGKNDRDFVLRDDDEFKDLIELSKEIKTGLKKAKQAT